MNTSSSINLNNGEAECLCLWEILLLNKNNNYNAKTIKKAATKISDTIKATSLNHPNDDKTIKLINQAAETLVQKSKDHKAVRHDDTCENLLKVAAAIRKRITKAGKQGTTTNRQTSAPWKARSSNVMELPDSNTFNPSQANYRQHLEKIRTHYYKGGNPKFRCQWKGYDIETTEDPEELIKWPTTTKTYLKGLTNRSAGTIIKRAPILAATLKKN